MRQQDKEREREQERERERERRRQRRPISTEIGQTFWLADQGLQRATKVTSQTTVMKYTNRINRMGTADRTVARTETARAQERMDSGEHIQAAITLGL